MTLGIYCSYHITFWEQSESHTALSNGALSDKIRMVVFNLTVTVAIIRNGALLEVVFTWPCSDGDTKASFISI